MFPFWELAIAPVLDAIGTRRCVEIGALRGETTTRMLKRLGPDAELHVIDPVPSFDPSAHEREFPGRYIFHRDLSLNVLPDLPPMDAALIDGDHNWYTVYHECKALADVARAHDAPLPVMILHDVCWPYGRRDLYYGPDGVPAEFRQPFEQKGIGIGVSPLLKSGGLNPTMYNAVEEGGPRNGVMTGLDDFIAEYDKPLRLLVLPIYFGLAIVVEEERLERQPELAAVLDHLESAEGRYELMELAERTRLQSMVFQHGVFYQREQQAERAAARYLDLLAGALLDEHYLENEVRIAHLLRCIDRGLPLTKSDLRDPRRDLKNDFKRIVRSRRAGKLRDDAKDPTAYFPYTAMGRSRIEHLQRCLDLVRTETVGGNLVECGTGRGGGAIFLRGYLEAHEMGGRTVFVADAFRASPTEAELGDAEHEPDPVADLRPDLNTVRDGFERFKLLDERVRFVQGDLPLTLPEAPLGKIALVRIGDTVHGEAGAVLDAVYDRVAVGGFVIVDEYNDPACRKAVDGFRARRGVTELLERVDGAGVFWRKLDEPAQPQPITEDTPEPIAEQPAPVADEPESAAAQAKATADKLVRRLRRVKRRVVALADRSDPVTAALPAAPAVGAPLAAPAPVAKPARKDLSVVVVFYNMKREAARTLQSLARSYQQGIDDLDYEVIAIENGSDPDQKLGEDFVRGFGPEFRYVDLGDDALPSPVFALNHGVALAGGRNIALMIDGAHVLTPGVLRWGMAGLQTYEPAIVATQQWYVGPGQQGDAMMDGYDKAYEDKLFSRIQWPANGYGLFEIGHFIGDRDWFDGLWESNCMFVPRSLIEQVGAFDETFSEGGGEYANLELYERLGSAPDVHVATILGEGSFHQIHGGTTTNLTDVDDRRLRITGYAEHYAAVRGRPFKGPGKDIHYVGTMFTPACRTRARRRISPAFFTESMPGDPDGLPESPSPIPDELKVAYTEAWWQNLTWQGTSWMGHTVAKSPTDLVVYQEILHDVRPDWVILVPAGDGADARFFASMCDLLDHGSVLAIDPTDPDDRAEAPVHPRLQVLHAPTSGDEVATQVAEIVGEQPHGLVVIGTRHKAALMRQEFETFAPFISVGSYAIMEDTIVNGHPVWPSFGPGPAEAAKHIINTHHDFIPDLTREKYTLSLNPGGYLKRVR